MASAKKEKLMIAVDGSDRSFEAVKYVAGYVPFREMEVVLFNVFTNIPKYYQDLEKDPQFHRAILEVRAWASSQRKVIEDFMERSRAKLVKAGFSENDVKVRVQDRKVGIARDIIKEAHNDYQFVVAARKGVSRIREVALGSTANKLVDGINFIPVILLGNRRPNKKVLLAVDGSEGAECAAKFVGKILGPVDDPVELVHVIRKSEDFQFDFQKYHLPDGAYEIVESESVKIFDEATKRLTNRGFELDRVSRKIITNTSRAVAIVKEADTGDFGTIAIGRRGLSRVRDFFLGRVSTKTIQMARTHTLWVVSCGYKF